MLLIVVINSILIISEIKGMCVCFKRSSLKYNHDDYEDYDDEVFGETSDNEGFYEYVE